MNTCGACSARTPEGIALCDTDADALLVELYAVPAIVEDLRTTFARQDNLRGPVVSVGKSTETPLVWNDRIPEVLDTLTEVLARWARPVVRERQLHSLPVIPHCRDPKDPARVPERLTEAVLAARVLSDNWRTVRTLRYAGDAFVEVLDAIRSARRVIDQPTPRRFIGPCGELGEESGVRCDHDVYAVAHRRTASCPACGAVHDVEQRHRALLAAAHDEVVTYAEAERALPNLLGRPVKGSTLRGWVHDGTLEVHGYRHAGKRVPTRVGYHDSPLVKVGDVIAAYSAAEVKETPAA